MATLACPACSTPAPAGSRFCPACGAALSPAAEATGPYDAGTPQTRQTPSTGSDAGASTRFLTGQLLAERYRIVAALGKGGMGEVYRADDLTLGQSVALKFLPPEVATDADRLSRFRSEVRIARQVSHPHVCRVYDIVEADNQLFLTMEYVDGQDLAGLLRRWAGCRRTGASSWPGRFAWDWQQRMKGE